MAKLHYSQSVTPLKTLGPKRKYKYRKGLHNTEKAYIVDLANFRLLLYVFHWSSTYEDVKIDILK
jgi:hypothetical protein